MAKADALKALDGDDWFKKFNSRQEKQWQ